MHPPVHRFETCATLNFAGRHSHRDLFPVCTHRLSQGLLRETYVATKVRLPSEEIAPRPFSLEEYHWLIEHGFFRADERVELIQGALHLMSPKSPRHAACQSMLLRQLFPIARDRARVRAHGPITLPEHDSEPEPDLALVASREGEYLDRHPYPPDVFLVVEIADSSLEYDRQVKVPLYAAAGITEYWLANLREYRIEVYREPISPVECAPFYRRRLIFSAQDSVSPAAFPWCVFPVIDLLPVQRS